MANVNQDNIIVKLENLTKIYKLPKGQTVTAIKNINLDIYKGDIFGIIGLSGAGKSTLIRCINYLEIPTEGDVYFKGIALGSLTNKELREARREIGMIFQNFNLLEQRNVLSNIMFPLEITKVEKEERIRRAKELLDLVGLSDKANAYPSQLSGGQKQRVAIARALATNPEVLLCDEATSALDPNTTNQILQLLKEINHKLGITIIVITHEMRVVETICNKVAILDESEVKELGDVSTIFVNPQTQIAKELIFPNLDIINREIGNTLININFEANVVDPIIANMILQTNVLVNICYANMKRENDKVYGEMILQLPDDETAIAKVCSYLKSQGIAYTVEENGGKNGE
jgi:D-methionine transport system ATP-binding protein